MSLYRKYRPQTFADVVGQDHIVTTLENASSQDKLAHAFLFAGSRGTGKTSVARILAKHVMTKGITDEVLQKQIIGGVEADNIVDLLEIDGASNRGIDDIRELIDKMQFSPVVASAKVYIIDEVHMLTKEAFNALLKTLEEPPPYAYFILATTELNKIPATIQSRCQCFPFRRIREEDIIRRLQYIADQEKIAIERDALRAIAHHVEGGMRDAISLLDQMRSLERINLEAVEQRIGSTGLQFIETVFTAIHENNAEAVVEVVQKIEEAGVSLEAFIRQMLGTVRKQLHTAVEQKVSTEDIENLLQILLQAVKDIRVSPVPGIVLEAALVQLCNTKSAPLPKVAAAKPVVQDAPKDVAEESTEPAQPSKAEKNETPNLPTEIEAPELTLDSVQQHWKNIVNAATPASVKMSLKNGRVVTVDDKSITVSFASNFHKTTVSKKDASIQVEKVLQDVFKRPVRLLCIQEEEQNPPSTVPSDEAVNIAEAAAEVF